MEATLFNNNDLLDCRSLCGYSFENVSSEVMTSLPPPQYIRNIIYTTSVLVKPVGEQGRENIIISLHKILVLNARHDRSHFRKKKVQWRTAKKISLKFESLKWVLSKEILNKIALFSTGKKKKEGSVVYKMMNGKKEGREWYLLYLLRQEHGGTKWIYQTVGFTQKLLLHIIHNLKCYCRRMLWKPKL